MKKSELKQIIKECITEILSESNIDIDTNKLKDIEVDGINKSDYPDFVDAYVVSAAYPIVDNPKGPKDWRELTDVELDWLNNKYPEIAQEAARLQYVGG